MVTHADLATCLVYFGLAWVVFCILGAIVERISQKCK